MNWYLSVLRKYAVFSGRARRREYWYYTLIHMTAVVTAMCLDAVVSVLAGYDSRYGIFSICYGLATFIPSIAVAVRRLHDTGYTGWLIFLGVIPILGAIALLFFLSRDSEPGDNEYGPNPKIVPALPPAVDVAWRQP